jgi:hypothetical protein
MGVTGFMVLDREDQKEDLVQALNEQDITLTGDACAAAEARAGNNATVNELTDVCNEGKDLATVTNVLLGVMLGTAALSGYFYYKAYIDEEAPAEPTPELDDEDFVSRPVEPAVRWRLTPAAGPDGASLGFQLEF